jgi:hypothetical protein
VKPGVQAPEEYVARYRGVVDNEKLARYYAGVTCMDEVIGKVLKALDDARVRELSDLARELGPA